MIYPYTKFYTSSSSGSLIIATKQKAKCRFCMAAMMLQILQKKTVGVNPTLEVHTMILVIIFMAENYEAQRK